MFLFAMNTVLVLMTRQHLDARYADIRIAKMHISLHHMYTKITKSVYSKNAVYFPKLIVTNSTLTQEFRHYFVLFLVSSVDDQRGTYRSD